MKLTCTVCGGSDFSLIHRGTRDYQNIDVIKCCDCGQVRLSSFSHITDEYYEKSGMRDNDAIRDMSNDEDIRNTIRRVQGLYEYYNNKDVLDFGCGRGTFLKTIREYARSVTGVELEEYTRNENNKRNINVIRDINEISTEFDCITMFHVIEHLVSPYKVLKDCYKHLRKDGVLILETPNANDALLTVYGCESFQNFSYWGCHVQLYLSSTLEKVLIQSGFKILWSKQIQRYSLSNHLYWLCNGKPGGHKVWKALSSGVLDMEYERLLSEKGCCDTLLVAAIKQA